MHWARRGVHPLGPLAFKSLHVLKHGEALNVALSEGFPLGTTIQQYVLGAEKTMGGS